MRADAEHKVSRSELREDVFPEFRARNVSREAKFKFTTGRNRERNPELPEVSDRKGRRTDEKREEKLNTRLQVNDGETITWPRQRTDRNRSERGSRQGPALLSSQSTTKGEVDP